MRKFVNLVIRVDSGIYDVNQIHELLREPGRFVKLETGWIRSLLTLLEYIQDYVKLVGRWVNHVTGLMKNLGATKEEIILIQGQQLSPIEFFQQKTFDMDYLRWVLTDASDEVDRLIAAYMNMLTEGVLIVELAEKFKGPFFNQVKQIALVWMSSDRREFYSPLINTLQSAHYAKTSKNLLHHLSKYLVIIGNVVATTPIFISTSTSVPYTIESLQSSRGLVKQLMQGMENLTTFVGLRTQAYILVLKHEEALMRAVLPPSINVSEWISNNAIQQSTSTDELLPQTLVTNALPLALRLADEALIEWDQTIQAAQTYLPKALLLNDLLQSPAVAKFLAADKHRLELYNEWRPRIKDTFLVLKEIISN